jgi:hypothetical protein
MSLSLRRITRRHSVRQPEVSGEKRRRVFLQALEAEAVNETKKARRTAQRCRSYTQAERLRPERLAPVADYPVASADEIQPFDEGARNSMAV